MNHRSFTVISLISLILVVITASIYDYYITTQPNNLSLRFGLKLIPITIIIINTCTYFFIYKIQFYAVLMVVGLLFSLLGDILMMIYIPDVPELSQYNNIIFLIIGGASFFVGRIAMSLALALYPFKTKKFIPPNLSFVGVLMSGFVCVIYVIFTIYYFVINIEKDLIKGFLPPYILIMGVQLFLSIIRYNSFKIETKSSQLLGIAGTLLFTVSDTMLFCKLFVFDCVEYFGVNIGTIAISIYWISMYLLGISVVRSSNHYTETNLLMPIPNFSIN